MKTSVWIGIFCFLVGGFAGLQLSPERALLLAPSAPKAPGKTTVAVLMPLTHPSLEDVLRGFKSHLAQSALGQDRVHYAMYNAHGDAKMLPGLAQAIVRDRPALVLSLTTPATVLAAKTIPQAGIPLVFAAVTDPLGAGIVPRLGGCELPITGVSDRYPVARQMRFLLALLPQVKTVGILRNPAEQNSQILSEESKAELHELGVKGELIDIASEKDIEPKVKAALASHDCLLINGDNFLVGAISQVIKLCVKAQKPLYVGDPDSVKKGALAAVGPNYLGLGKQAGRQAAAILSGTRAGSLPCESAKEFDYILNAKAALGMGVKIPAEALRATPVWESVALPR